MITAIVMLKIQRDRINDVAGALADMDGISEVYSVSGRYDLIAIIRTATTDALSEVVTGQMLKVSGIIESETMLAFQCFSKHALESMFAIGTES